MAMAGTGEWAGEKQSAQCDPVPPRPTRLSRNHPIVRAFLRAVALAPLTPVRIAPRRKSA